MIYILFLSFTAIILIIALYQLQHFIIFRPTFHRTELKEKEFQIIAINTDDNLLLEGVVYEPTDSTTINGTILFFAGRSHDVIGIIKKLSISFPKSRIITFNYRSYGRSQGTITEKNIFADADKIAKLVQKNYGNFYLLGFSIGSAIVCDVATKHKNLGVFLVGTFDSLNLLIQHKYNISLNFILKYKFNNIQKVQQIDAKTYIFATQNDSITYIENARNLKKYVKNLYEYIELKEVSHNELIWNNQVINKINDIIQTDFNIKNI